jgi:hypothetical protein
MGDGTSVPDLVPRVQREAQRFGTIIVVGGGCYGSYYVRQLLRAERAGALAWHAVLVVDRDARCTVARLSSAERPSRLATVASEWGDYFSEYLGRAASDPASHDGDAIVPSPLMPHLMADWLADRIRVRRPDRRVTAQPLARPPAVPWQRAGEDGTHYVSFAEWMCPINCIEPPRCPHTKGDRTWSLPPALASYAASERNAGRPLEGPYVFHCAHRAYGVGMLDVRDILAADRAIAARDGAGDSVSFLVGTASHCHGAVRRIYVE